MKRFDGVLILSDMDGTLLNSKREVSAGNRRAIEYFIENGGRFSLATGRVKAAMEYFLQDFSVNAPAVICNGAMVYDFERGQPVEVRPVGSAGYDLALDVMERFPEVGVEVYLQDSAYIAKPNAIARRHFTYVNIPVAIKAAAEIPQPWVNLNFTLEAEKMKPFTSYLQQQYGERFHGEHSLPYFYEVTRKDANKGTGALAVCKHLGISPEHLYVVGDGGNDVDLLRCTKNSFATANAWDEIKGIASHLLPSNDDDAIAALIALLDKKYGAETEKH